jgi:O-antigen/teichoic acid export membrane protein
MNQLVGKYIEEFKVGFNAKGSFIHNLTITFSGNIAAQALGFLFTPFIARIYGPQVYGLFALFISITNNLAPIATLQFPSSYVISKNENEFHNLLKITFITLVVFTTISLLSVHFFKSELLTFFNAPELGPFVYLIPLYFFLMGVDHVFAGWNIRNKEFFRGALSKIVSTSASKGVTVLWGILLAPTPIGMILGNLLLFPMEILGKFNRRIGAEIIKAVSRFSWRSIFQSFYHFRAYAFFVTPGMIINNISNQLPVYYFSVAFNQTVVGYFALANSLVMMPISIIINSSTSVFLQKAAEVHQSDPTALKPLVLKLYKKLSTLSIVAVTGFALSCKWAFLFLFGEAWTEAGAFASVLAFGSLFFVPAGPLSVLFRITKKEHVGFNLNVIFTIVKFLALYWGIYHNNIIYSVIGFSLASMVYYGVMLFWIFKIVDINKNKLYQDFLIVALLFGLILFLHF